MNFELYLKIFSISKKKKKLKNIFINHMNLFKIVSFRFN